MTSTALLDDTSKVSNSTHSGRGAFSNEVLQRQLDSLPLNWRHWLVFGLCSAGLLFDSLDVQLMSFAAPHIMKEWGLTPEALGAIISATIIGMIAGTYLFGTLADIIGRRLSFQITIGIFSVFTGLAGFTSTIFQLVSTRFLAGVGIGGSIPVETAVFSEFIPARVRGRLTALWCVSFSIGGFIAPVCAWAILPNFGWRALFFVGAIPALLVFALRWLIPETPRYLLMKGKVDEAEKAVSWVAGRPLDVSQSAKRPEEFGATPAKIRPVSSILELFSKAYRRQTILSWLIWLGWGFSYYGLILWLPTLLTKYRHVPQAEVFYFMMGFAVSGVVGRLVMMAFVDSAGRKPVIGACGLLGSLTLLVFGYQTEYSSILLWGYATAFFLDGGYSAIIPYVPELFPTCARGTGIGWATGVGRIAAALAPIAVGIVVPTGIINVFYVLAPGALLAAVATMILGEETKGRALIA